MKRYFALPTLLLSLLYLCSCGESEDPEKLIAAETDPFLRIETLVEQLQALEIGVPNNWEKTRDPVERAAYTRYLISAGRIPVSLDLNDLYSQDPIVQAEYTRAQYVKRFGDIPEVHTFADFLLISAMGIYPSDDEIAASKNAYAFLFPSRTGADKIPLHQFLREEENTLAKIRMDDPKAWAEHNRAKLIKEYGDTHAVRTIADFMEKIELELSITEEEYNTYKAKIEEVQSGVLLLDQFYVKLEAENQLGIHLSDIDQCRLKLYRWAKSEGIPFIQIKWELIDEEHEACQQDDL